MYNPNMALLLSTALRMTPTSCVTFIGAGGKTTAMYKLARELKTDVILTATTHLGAWQIREADHHIATEEGTLDSLEAGIHGRILVTGALDGDRTRPINVKLLDWLHRFCMKHAIPLLIEADGSRQKPLKAWADHEPPVPVFADIVVQVAGLSGVGKPLSEEYVHRSDIYSTLSGLDAGETITPETIARTLTHQDVRTKNIPDKARRIVLLNQADTLELQSIARAMTPQLLSAYQGVVIASVMEDKTHAVHEPVAGIILAAGASTRFGKPKQLLEWKGEPFIRVIVKKAIQAGLSPVIVVTGANAEQIEQVISGFKVKIVRNSDWKTGQGSSIRNGILSIDSASDENTRDVGAVIFLLADQPQINPSIIQALIEKHAQGLHPIVAPMVLDRRGNPVLFDRVTFSDLTNIEGDSGGRAIFHKHPVEYLPWHDDSLLLDVDTPEQYQRLISNEDL